MLFGTNVHNVSVVYMCLCCIKVNYFEKFRGLKPEKLLG